MEVKQVSLFDNQENEPTTVECLGMTFNSEDERREYFRNELRKKLPELKEIEGYPIGEDEDIIALSDPPYYTACPNPWMNEFIKKNINNKDNYSKKPFNSDVSEGKTDGLYLAHGYHTKVPHKAIMRYLLHYTDPGDIVLDGFSGTGMTGVAASLCDDIHSLESLGLTVKDDDLLISDNGEIYTKGKRNVLLNDISPLASFVSYNYNNPIDYEIFIEKSNEIMNYVKEEYGWMYNTKHSDGNIGTVQYTVYSDVFECPNCYHEIVFYDVCYDKKNKSVKKEFFCPHCDMALNKTKMNRIFRTEYDAVGKAYNFAKQIPVLINYKYLNETFEKIPDEFDLSLIKKIQSEPLKYEIPNFDIPDGVNLNQPRVSHGLVKIHHFYTKKSLLVLSKVFDLLNQENNRDIKFLKFIFEQAVLGMSKLARYVPTHYSQVNQYLSGTLYIGSQIVEVSLEYIINGKVKRITKLLKEKKFPDNEVIVSTQAIQSLKNLTENSIDYIFTDPPFGANLMYSDLNILWESWLKVFTNSKQEAIVNKIQNKNVNEYQSLMQQSFDIYYRCLKPNRWITVEFSNSKAEIWNAIQESMQKAGFIIASVSALDKKQGSFKSVTSTVAVKQDLVITAYKPSLDTVQLMMKEQNTINSVWLFIEGHLNKLSIFEGEKGQARIISERTPRILFDRMVAYHVQNGLPVPISSAEFQEKVAQKYVMRDGMVFLESQVAEYDKKRILAKDFAQQSLFVSDEGSAIEWLRQQLLKKPQTRQDLHPQFMKEIQHIAKHEDLPELDNLLAENFLNYTDEGTVPDQIASYLRKNYHDMRGLDNDDEKLKAKAKNRWYVPDPSKQADLEKLREKSLLREFNHYVEEVVGTKKKLKVFRTEAIRAGFKKAWSERNYQEIVEVAERLPEKVIQEDDKLLMYYDNASIRLEM